MFKQQFGVLNTMMETQNVDSSMATSVGYDPEASTLEIVFKKPERYGNTMMCQKMYTTS